MRVRKPSPLQKAQDRRQGVIELPAPVRCVSCHDLGFTVAAECPGEHLMDEHVLNCCLPCGCAKGDEFRVELEYYRCANY